MSDNIDKHIENLVDKTMMKSSLESPSFDFTNSVMAHVNALGQSSVTTYKPLISKPMWFVIFAVGLGIVMYIIFGLNTTDSGWLNSVDLSMLTDNRLSNTLSGFKVSKTVTYAVVLFGLMVFIQVPILKHYFDKRIAV